jgi:hypothetical protein
MSTPTPLPPAGGTPVSVLGSTLLPSVLRTVVPIIYALLVRKGVVEWLGFDDALVNNALTLLVTALFYVVLRVAERYWDKIGWLLGYAQQPVYVQGQVIAVEETPTPPTTTTVVETDENPVPGD